jgi:rhodanese-related sulfurtransferase
LQVLEVEMLPVIVDCVAVVTVMVAGVVLFRHMQARRELAAYSVDADGLYALLNPERKVVVFDIRQPLDLLAHSEIIPGAVRVAPKEVLANPSLVPMEQDAVIYCTCPGDKTSRDILHRVLALQFRKVKMLRGGLEAWKAKGYPVERYDKAFRLDTAS